MSFETVTYEFNGSVATIAMDRPEIDGLVDNFWKAMRGGDAFPQRAPLADDPTVAELGRHLDRLVGGSVLRAA